MSGLIEKLSLARDIATESEPDIRVKEFLGAITIRQNISLDVRLSFTISIDCHFRSWHKCILPGETLRLGAMSPGELAQTIAGWVQAAVEGDLLSLSNPPLNRMIDLARPAVGGVVTFIYDKDYHIVGKRW